MRDLSREPRTYELMTILHPDVPEEELQSALDRVASHVTGAGGTISATLRESPWGRRRLSYPIRHGGRDLRDGYYTVFHVTLGPERVVEMEQEIKLDTQIIRYLVTTYAPKPLDARALEAAEIAAEDEAAAAYVAAQVSATRAAAQTAASEPAAAETAAVAAAAVASADEPTTPEVEPLATEAPADDDAATEMVTETTLEEPSVDPAAVVATAEPDVDDSAPVPAEPEAATAETADVRLGDPSREEE